MEIGSRFDGFSSKKMQLASKVIGSLASFWYIKGLFLQSRVDTFSVQEWSKFSDELVEFLDKHTEMPEKLFWKRLKPATRSLVAHLITLKDQDPMRFRITLTREKAELFILLTGTAKMRSSANNAELITLKPGSVFGALEFFDQPKPKKETKHKAKDKDKDHHHEEEEEEPVVLTVMLERGCALRLGFSDYYNQVVCPVKDQPDAATALLNAVDRRTEVEKKKEEVSHMINNILPSTMKDFLKDAQILNFMGMETSTGPAGAGAGGGGNPFASLFGAAAPGGAAAGGSMMQSVGGAAGGGSMMMGMMGMGGSGAHPNQQYATGVRQAMQSAVQNVNTGAGGVQQQQRSGSMSVGAVAPGGGFVPVNAPIAEESGTRSRAPSMAVNNGGGYGMMTHGGAGGGAGGTLRASVMMQGGVVTGGDGYGGGMDGGGMMMMDMDGGSFGSMGSDGGGGMMMMGMGPMGAAGAGGGEGADGSMMMMGMDQGAMPMDGAGGTDGINMEYNTHPQYNGAGSMNAGTELASNEAAGDASAASNDPASHALRYIMRGSTNRWLTVKKEDVRMVYIILEGSMRLLLCNKGPHDGVLACKRRHEKDCYSVKSQQMPLVCLENGSMLSLSPECFTVADNFHVHGGIVSARSSSTAPTHRAKKVATSSVGRKLRRDIEASRSMDSTSSGANHGNGATNTGSSSTVEGGTGTGSSSAVVHSAAEQTSDSSALGNAASGGGEQSRTQANRAKMQQKRQHDEDSDDEAEKPSYDIMIAFQKPTTYIGIPYHVFRAAMRQKPGEATIGISRMLHHTTQSIIDRIKKQMPWLYGSLVVEVGDSEKVQAEKDAALLLDKPLCCDIMEIPESELKGTYALKNKRVEAAERKKKNGKLAAGDFDDDW